MNTSRPTSVISGIGTVTGYGVGAPACFEGLVGDRAPATRETAAWPGEGPPMRTRGIDVALLKATLPPQQLRAVTPDALMLQVAAGSALSGAGLDARRLETMRMGVVASTQHAGLQDYAEQLWAGMREEDGIVSATRGPWAGINAPAGNLSIRLETTGPNVTLVNGAVGGIDALAYALDALATGRADAMLVCGVEALPPVAVAALGAAEDRPRPFDRDRRGPAYGDVAAALVLEPESACTARGGVPVAAVAEVGTAYSPDPVEASTRVLRGVLEASGLEPDDVGACFAGANGSVDGDAFEARAIGAVFGDAMPVCAVKGGIGECAGAAAVAQAAVAALSLERQLVPPTPGFDRGDEAMSFHVTGEPEPLRREAVVVHSWDEGGAAGAAVLRRCDGGASA